MPVKRRKQKTVSDITLHQNVEDSPGENPSDVISGILDILSFTLQSAKNNPTAANVNAVLKSLGALKLAGELSFGRQSTKSREVISRKIMSYIESEILGIHKTDSDA